MVKGKRVSLVQRKLAALVSGELNEPVGKYAVDVACLVSGTKVAIEYDSWYYHAERQADDDSRCEYLVSHGWHVLQIRSNYLLPEHAAVRAAIEEMLAKSLWRSTLTLRDWGVGNFLVAKGKGDAE
jgi:very-short-patch-repair endonuclease